MADLEFLKITNIDDIKDIDLDLKLLVLANAGKDKPIKIQFTLNVKTVSAIIGWVYTFWTFGKTWFFPDGKFRMPKFLEFRRNFQIIKAILKLKNALVGLWHDKDKATSKINEMVKKAQHG